MKTPIFTLLLLCLISSLKSQPTIEWEWCYGGSKWDRLTVAIPTTDGGYMIGGASGSSNGNTVCLSSPASSIFLHKLSFTGEIEWSCCIIGQGYIHCWKSKPDIRCGISLESV